MVRQFGVEIEVETPDRYGEVSRDWLKPIVQDAVASLNSFITENVGYSHRVTPFWKITSDGSVSRGSEIVSPILRGRNGEDQVKAVCANLRAHYPTDIALSDSCGVHVHLDIMSTSWAPTNFTRGDRQTVCDMRRRSPKFKRITNRLFETTRWFDPAIQQVLPPSRRTNGFCRPFENGYSPDEWFDWFEDYYPDLNGRSSARYYRINFSNCFNEFGTFEWRSHAGSLNATKIMQWTKLCQKFLTFSYAPEWQHKDPHDFPRDLDGLINCFELPADQVRFWRNRARQLGNYTPTIDRSPVGGVVVELESGPTEEEIDEERGRESVEWYDWMLVEVDLAAGRFGRELAEQEYTHYRADPDQSEPPPAELYTDESAILLWPEIWNRLPNYTGGTDWFDPNDYGFEDEPSEELLVAAEQSFADVYTRSMDERMRARGSINSSIPIPYRNPNLFSTLVNWLNDEDFYNYYVNMSDSQLDIFYRLSHDLEFDSVIGRQAALEAIFRAEGGFRFYSQNNNRVNSAALEAAESAVVGFGQTGRNMHDWHIIFNRESAYREAIGGDVGIVQPLSTRLLWMSTLVIGTNRAFPVLMANELRPMDEANVETFVETFLIGVRELI